MPTIEVLTIPELMPHARALSTTRTRTLIGIVGQPGAGKSFVAQALVDALTSDAALVPMDGFRLRNATLTALSLLDRQGAPETFDAAGHVALLHQLRNPDDQR